MVARGEGWGAKASMGDGGARGQRPERVERGGGRTEDVRPYEVTGCRGHNPGAAQRTTHNAQRTGRDRVGERLYKEECR
jgi:hypothetical protein